MVEAAGVEPASQARKPAATTCLVRVDFRPRKITPTRNAQLSQHGISRRLTRCPRKPPPRLNSFVSPSRDQGTNVADLGCEGQLFVSFYVFGPMFYEANEPSSACRLRRTHMVETSTPPSRRLTSHNLHAPSGRSSYRSCPRRIEPRWTQRTLCPRGKELSVIVLPTGPTSRP